MKTSILFVAIATAAVTAVSCGKKGDDEPAKSSACEIRSFKDGDKAWTVSGTSITASYPKGTNLSSVAPVVEVSPKATVKPASGAPQDFSQDRKVTYTVTAEDGKTAKTYTAQATTLAN